MPASKQKVILGLSPYRWLGLFVATLALFALSVIIRDQLDIEWSIESLRSFVESKGVWGPIAYIGILSFRFLLLIPSSLLLVASGIMFGAFEGALYAGLGLFGSSLVKYIAAVAIGRDVLLRQLSHELREMVVNFASKKEGGFALAGICAYPYLPKHVFQISAILSGMGLSIYVLSTLLGSFVRAALFSNVGDAIYSSTGLVSATLVMLVPIIIPLCVPTWRRWMFTPTSQFFSSLKKLKGIQQ